MFTEMPILTQPSGGGGNACLEVYSSDSDMTNCTDATPIIIQGSFEGLAIFAQGIYNKLSGYRDDGYSIVNNPVLGTTYQVQLGAHSSDMKSWRKVTVYSDRVVIGSGGYGTTTDSNYGLIQTIAVR